MKFKHILLVMILCLIPLTSWADSKSMCPDKVLDTGTVEGIYQGNECEDFCYSSITLDNGDKFVFMCGEDVAETFFGKNPGQRVSVTYEVQQFWNESGDECSRVEMCKSGKVLKKSQAK